MFHIFLDCLLKQERNMILAGEYTRRYYDNSYMGRRSETRSHETVEHCIMFFAPRRACSRRSIFRGKNNEALCQYLRYGKWNPRRFRDFLVKQRLLDSRDDREKTLVIPYLPYREAQHFFLSRNSRSFTFIRESPVVSKWAAIATMTFNFREVLVYVREMTVFQ